MLKRRSVVFVIVVAVLILFHFANFYVEKTFLRSEFKTYTETREKVLLGLIELGAKMASAGSFDSLREALESARHTSQVDFYILQDHGHVKWWGNSYSSGQDINIKYPVTDQFLVRPKVTYETITVSPDVFLTIGIAKDIDYYVESNMQKYAPLLYLEASFFAFIVLIVALWAMRDLRSMVAKIRRGDTGNIAEIKTQSAEAELLARGFRGFNEKVDRLEQANDKFSNQVLPSLKSELFSGRTPPYFFECTMVRTDINGFSHIFNTHDTNVFMAHINEFFTEVSHIVSRYGGFIHEFVGDEVIYYFKDEHHANSFAVALGALADIQRAAEVLNQKTRTQNSYGFSVKSSLSHGSLRFGPLVNGYTLAGSVLIESVRVLSQVAEKDQNVIYFDQANLMRIAGVGRAEVALKAHLKGFDGERTLYRFEGHAPLAEVLAAPQVDAAKLSFYRSGRDLAQIFDWLRVYGESVDEATVASVIRTLRGVNVTRASYEFSQALFLWLETVAADFSRSRDLRHARVLSAAALLVRNLIPKAEFNDEIDARVEQFLAVDDKRVVANVLEALTEFRIDRDKNFVVGLLSSNDHRVQANAFIHRGIREIDRDLTVRLRKAIFGKDFHAAASALYALGEIVAFHYQRDSVYLQAQVDFYQLVESLPKLVLSSDAMVRRQSLIAARKSNDAKVQAAIRALVDRSDTLREEIKIHWSAIDSQAAATTGNAAPASAA